MTSNPPDDQYSITNKPGEPTMQTAYHHACEIAANELLNLNGNPRPRTAQELAEKWHVEAHHIQEVADRIRARINQEHTMPTEDTQPLTLETMENLIGAIVRMEHKGGHMTASEYLAAASLCTAAGAPQFFTDYFAKKAQENQQ